MVSLLGDRSPAVLNHLEHRWVVPDLLGSLVGLLVPAGNHTHHPVVISGQPGFRGRSTTELFVRTGVPPFVRVARGGRNPVHQFVDGTEVRRDGMSPGRGMIGPATSPHGQDGGVIPTLVRSQSPPEIRDSALGEGPSRPSPHADPPAKAPAIAMALWERSKGLRLIPSSALVRVGRSRIGPHGDPHRHRRPDPAANGEGQLRLGTSRSGQP